jgi:hypothetical protein
MPEQPAPAAQTAPARETQTGQFQGLVGAPEPPKVDAPAAEQFQTVVGTPAPKDQAPVDGQFPTLASAGPVISPVGAATPIGQAAPAAPPPPPATLAPALSAVQTQSPVIISTLERTHPAKWKVKNEERSDVEHNFLTVKSDLDETLPGLLADAQRSPQSLDKGMAVYHNVVALNNVLVRLQQTAQLTGGQEDATILQQALAGVEVVRRQLQDALAAVEADQVRALAQTREALQQEKTKEAAALAAAKAARAASAAEDAANKKKVPAKGTRHVASKTAKPATATPPAAAKKPVPATGQSQAQ